MAVETFPVGPSVMTLPPGSGSFSIATPPTPSVGTKQRLKSNWTTGPTGKDPYRAWTTAILDGFLFAANGFDQPFFWNGSDSYHDMGSVVPSEFTAGASGGSGWLADGDTATYRLVFYDSVRGRESAPEAKTATASGSAQDVDITWTTTTLDGFDNVRIYRQLADTGFYVLVTTELLNSSPYKDTEDDDTIRLRAAYVRRWRETKPPIFTAIASHLNRVWGITGLDSLLYYSQTSRTDGHFVVDDFPTANLEEIGPHDGDTNTAVFPKYGALILFKRRSAYRLDGENAANFVITRLFSDRGAFNQRCVLDIEGWTYFLDERGLYFTDLRSEPFVAGAGQGSQESPLQSIWSRLNRDASQHFSLYHSESQGLLYVQVALDHRTVPDTIICYDTRDHRFVSIDSGVPAFAAGILDDASGVQHECRGDELHALWEIHTGNADGVFAGDTTGAITSVVGYQGMSLSAASLDVTDADGTHGVPFDRYNSAGSVVDYNRNITAGTTSITPLYWAATAPTATDTIAVGTIPALGQILKSSFRTPDKKHVARVEIETKVETGGTLRIDTAPDSASFVNQREITLSAGKGRQVVPVHDRGWRWHMRWIQRYAGMDFKILALNIVVKGRKDRQ